MKAIISLAIKDLLKRWAVALVLAVLFGITFASFLTMATYQRNSNSSYVQLEKNWLVVGNSDGLSEFHGSRLTPADKELLVQKGYPDPIPEIHQIIATSYSNQILMHGFRLDDYFKISPFKLLSGRRLEPGDLSRLAMVGETLARTKDVQVGSDFLLRGRKFQVIGIFQTGTIQDNEAWVSLEDAQNLLNYGDDVSTYLIPDSGSLQSGDLLTEGVSVTQKGESAKSYDHTLLNFFKFVGLVGNLVGVATAITLANLLWRLAYLRRHEFGILKSLGFGFRALLLYFFTQCGLIVFFGLILGLSAAIFLLFANLQNFSSNGFGLNPTIDIITVSSMVLLTFGMLAVGVVIPLLSINRTSIPDLLGRN